MPPLTAFVVVVWGIFWLYWLASAPAAKRGVRSPGTRGAGLLITLLGGLAIGLVRAHNAHIHAPIARGAGVVLFLAGLCFALWARLTLGANWGMPMTQMHEPELVTTGPYRLVRHPIYSGILLGVLGTAIAIDLGALVMLAVMGAYFIYAARVEEGLLRRAFPSEYPEYANRTKMLIPFVL